MNFATKQRILLGIAVLLMFTPTFLYSAGMLGQAPLYEGDVRKEMGCLTCDGMGRTDKEETCGTCRGRGVAEFILPGPNRPLQLVGTVLNSSGEKQEGANIAVHEAGVTPGENGAKEILFLTNGDGQFGVKLPPGEYVIKAGTEGGSTVQESVLIEQNPSPVPATKMETLHKIEKEFRLP
jgi:hypothetical protein